MMNYCLLATVVGVGIDIHNSDMRREQPIQCLCNPRRAGPAAAGRPD